MFQNLGSIGAATAANNASTATLTAANSALSALVEAQNAVRGYAATGDKSFPPRIAGFQDSFRQSADKLDALVTDDALKGQIQALRQEADRVADEEAGQIALRQEPARAADLPASIITKGRLTESRRILKQITDAQQALLTARSAEQAKALEQIVAQVSRLNGLVSDIAGAAQELALGMQQVNTTVNDMDRTTQQNAAMVEEASAASATLATEAATLARLIGQFQVKADEGGRQVRAA